MVDLPISNLFIGLPYSRMLLLYLDKDTMKIGTGHE